MRFPFILHHCFDISEPWHGIPFSIYLVNTRILSPGLTLQELVSKDNERLKYMDPTVRFMTIGVWKPQKVTWKGVQQQPTQNPKTRMNGCLINSRTDLTKVAVDEMDQG
ncbi:hypothetical protein EJB05_27183, partial [Eragrostis curvula]